MKTTFAHYKWMVLFVVLAGLQAGAETRPTRSDVLDHQNKRIDPVVINTGSEQSVKPGLHVMNSIRQKDSTFRVLEKANFNSDVLSYYGTEKNQLPQAIVGDFNNDGLQDTVLMGLSQSNRVVVYAAMATRDPNKYDIKLVQTWPAKDRQVNMWRNMGRGHFKLTNWPYQLRLADKDQLMAFHLNKKIDHLKWEGMGNQEALYVYRKRQKKFEIYKKSMYSDQWCVEHGMKPNCANTSYSTPRSAR